MATRSWSFLQNPFLTATRTSYIRASIIGTFTDAALHGNPELATIYAYFHPYAENYNHLYAKWRTQTGTKKGKTLGLKNLLSEATTRINDWEYRVQAAFKKDTPAFKSIFPNGHAFYQQGSQQRRIEAFETLSLALAAAGQAELAAEVAAYHESLVEANAKQKSAVGQTGQKSTDLEAARRALCRALYHVLGNLMAHFDNAPEAIRSYFRLELIQRRQQKTFTGHTAPGAVSLIAQRSLKSEAEIGLLNGGAGPLVFFLSNRADAPPPAAEAGVTVEPGTEQTVAASSLGPVETAHYLLVFNPDTAAGAWEVDV